MFFSKTDLSDMRQTYCITTALWTYAQSARPTRGRSFFYIAHLNWTLKPPYFNACLKEMAVYFKLDQTRISSHSLRIGGASALAAAGVPDYIILDMGRWKSLAFLAYVRRNTQMFEVARYALSRNDLGCDPANASTLFNWMMPIARLVTHFSMSVKNLQI